MERLTSHAHNQHSSRKRKQMAKIVRFHEIGGPEVLKRRGLLASGADHVIVTDEEDLVCRVREITGGAGARIIYDPIAGPLLDKLADTAAPGATIFQYGWLSGEPTPFPLILALQKGLTIRGYWLWETVKNPESFARGKDYLYELVKRRGLQPKLAKTFPFEDLAPPYPHLESTATIDTIRLAV